MEVQLFLHPNIGFMADIPKKDRLHLARELESDSYPQGKFEVMCDGRGWSPLGIWEWCSGYSEDLLRGFRTPLEAELDENQTGFQATLSGGLYIESLSYANVAGLQVNTEQPYQVYDPMINVTEFVLGRCNEPFQLFLGHVERHEDLIEFRGMMGFHKIAGLLRGKTQVLVLEEYKG